MDHILDFFDENPLSTTLIVVLVAITVILVDPLGRRKNPDCNPFAVGDKVEYLGKVGVVLESGYYHGAPEIVVVRFLMSGPDGERFESVQFRCPDRQLTFAKE